MWIFWWFSDVKKDSHALGSVVEMMVIPQDGPGYLGWCWERTVQAAFPSGMVLSFRFGDWCLACNRFSSGRRKERQRAKGELRRPFQEIDLRQKKQRQLFLRRWPKRISPNITKSSKDPKLFRGKTIPVLFLACSPTELKQVDCTKTLDDTVRVISLESQACKSNQLSVGQRLAVRSVNPD